MKHEFEKDDLKLLLAYLDESLSQDDFDGLVQRLRTEPQLMQRLLGLAGDEERLHEWAESSATAKTLESVLRERALNSQLTTAKSGGVNQLRKLRVSRRWLVAFPLLLVALISIWTYSNRPPVASIVRAENAFFEGRDFTENTRLWVSDRVHIKSGLVEIAYRSGARVVLQGHSNYLISGFNSGRLERGILSAEIEESADGFVVTSAKAKVTDLGTKFCVLAEDGNIEVEVLEGEVVAKSKNDSNNVSLVEGKAASIDHQSVRSIAAGGLQFETARKGFREKTIETRYSHYACGGSATEDKVEWSTQPCLLLKRNYKMEPETSRKAWIRFDLAGHAAVLDKPATFTFRHHHTHNSRFVAHVACDIEIYAMKKGEQAEVKWTADTLTWNNAPANDRSHSSNLIAEKVELLGEMTVNSDPSTGGIAEGAPLQVKIPDLSPYVQDDQSITLILTLRDQTPVQHAFRIANHESTKCTGPSLTFHVQDINHKSAQ